MKYKLGAVFPFPAFFILPMAHFVFLLLCVSNKNFFVAIPTTAVEAEEGSGKKSVFCFLWEIAWKRMEREKTCVVN